MKVLITGGSGFIARRLAARLAEKGTLRGHPVGSITLADIAEPSPLEAPVPADTVVCDITDRAAVDRVVSRGPDVVFHLAAIVSAHAEAEFDTGMQVNLFGTLNLLESCRALGTTPVFVYTSTLAVYGGEVPDPIRDWTLLNPQSSYGTQKAAGELLLNDYSRRGYVDGRGFRLPTISVRPGRPNRAASSFMSSIIREPLNGQEAVCPVDPEFLHYYLSPRRCVENLIRGAEIEAEALGQNRCMTMPGRTWSIRQMIEAMTEVAGPEPAKLIRWEDQPEIRRIVSTWRHDVRPEKALSLGLVADDSYTENVRFHLED